MDTLQTMFESALIKQGKKTMVEQAIQIIEQKSRRAGNTLSIYQKYRLRKILQSDKLSKMTLRFRGKSSKGPKSIAFTKKDAQEVVNQFESYLRKLDGIAGKISETQAHLILSALRRRWPRQKSCNQRLNRGFQKRLLAAWKTPLDLLEMHIAIALEVGSALNEQYRERGKLKTPLSHHTESSLLWP